MVVELLDTWMGTRISKGHIQLNNDLPSSETHRNAWAVRLLIREILNSILQ